MSRTRNSLRTTIYSHKQINTHTHINSERRGENRKNVTKEKQIECKRENIRQAKNKMMFFTKCEQNDKETNEYER